MIVAMAGVFTPGLAAANDNNFAATSPILKVREPAFYSPQVMELMRYDNHTTVSHNTGCINPAISLVDFQDKDFDFPISISYNSSGFRPRNQDNYVGRDWMLNVGGVVYRKVNGIPDDFKGYRNEGETFGYTGFLDMLGKKIYNMDTMKQEVEQNPYKYAHLEYINSGMLTIPSRYNRNWVETSPDIFYFSFGKHSGKFMINYDGSVSVVGYNGGKYQVDLTEMKPFTDTTPQETYIKIKTDDGYVYTFGGGGFSSLEYNAISWKENYHFTTTMNSIHEITAFHLTQITAPNGRTLRIFYRDIDNKYHEKPVHLISLENFGDYDDNMLIQYQLSGKSQKITSYSVQTSDGGKTEPMYKYSNADRVYALNKVALIDRIETDECIINFFYSKRDKHPMPVLDPEKTFYTDCGAKLDAVRLTYKSRPSIADQTNFTYEYALGNRMFLKCVDTYRDGKYYMEYNTSNISNAPTPMTIDIDHWGFWRGEGDSNAICIPGMDYPFSEHSLNYRITTNHRDATGKYFDAGLLKRLTYPTGGSAQYTYEPHRYSTLIQQNNSSTHYPTSDYLSPSSSGLAGGARIYSIRYLDANNKVQKETLYTYGSLSREGKIMYMPVYRHYTAEKDINGKDKVKNRGYAYSSEGFTDTPYPGVHIRYPEVTEHYIDPSKGGINQKHSCKKIEFQTELDLSSFCYSPNKYFQSQETSGNTHQYTLFHEEYLTYLKHLVAHPTDDLSNYYSKVSRETYYDDNGRVQKKVQYNYTFLNQDEYSLCIYNPTISPNLRFQMFQHIGREYFRMYVPTSITTTTYHGEKNDQIKVEHERLKYDNSGYLKERSIQKNSTDSLTTVHQYEEYPTGNGFQVLPTAKEYYISTSTDRRLLKRQEMNYRKHSRAATPGQYWNVMSEALQYDEKHKQISSTEYTHYDDYGNVIESVENGSKHTVYLWSRHGQAPRARIENASYEEVKTALGHNPEDLSSSTADNKVLDGIRSLLPHARMYTYWSFERFDINISTAANGRSTHAFYRSGGKLTSSFRYDENGKIELLQMNTYNIIND